MGRRGLLLELELAFYEQCESRNLNVQGCEMSLHFRHCDKNINANIVPVDMTVNALIVSAYDTATKRSQNIEAVEKPEIPIYNYVSSVQNPLTWGRFTDLNIAYGFDYPFSSAIWWVLKQSSNKRKCQS